MSRGAYICNEQLRIQLRNFYQPLKLPTSACHLWGNATTMSSFGSKRKARKITVQDDDDGSPSLESLNPPPESQEPALQPTFKSRKPFKQSSLRKSITFNDEAPGESGGETKTSNSTDETEDQEDGGAPVRIQPLATKPGVAKSKKRQSSSRLSFGPSEVTSDDDDAMVLGEEAFTPKKPGLAASATENSAYKKAISKNLPLSRLPMRSMEDDNDRPRYSKEYLSELQSATPNTPQDLSSLHITSGEDEISLDPSELEGAMIVDTDPSTSLTTGPSTTAVLTEAEIREKKERRARLAKQKGSRDTEDFISLSDDDDNDERRAGDSYLALLSRKGGSKPDTRLVAEDEDLGEGFDEFVEDGGLSLGRRAEREARKRHRAEMASLISAAEGAGSDGEGAASDDSEAERRAAFEAAQTRAGMDGLAEEREQQRKRLGAREGVVPVPPKITPLPDLSVLVEAFKARMRQKETDLIRVRAHIAGLKAEREGIVKREPEVQRLLNEAGERYRALMMPGGAENAQTTNTNGDSSTVTAARTLLDQFRDGGPGTPGERGLESLGTTPVRQQAQMEL
ncbi:nineteen complex-related protein 2-domain-containing protein [Xylaria acuta]|nr:nineteen complex-related protein 2-domain-containing protein [Xylaria acuta]